MSKYFLKCPGPRSRDVLRSGMPHRGTASSLRHFPEVLSSGKIYGIENVVVGARTKRKDSKRYGLESCM